MPSIESIHDLASQFANARDFYFGFGDDLRSADPDFMLYRSQVPQARRNGVLRYGLGEGGLDQALARARAELDGRPWRWWVGADSPAGLPEQLLARGAVAAGVLPVMAAEIGRLDEVRLPVGLSVEEVAGPAMLEEWVRTYSPSLGVAPERIPANVRSEGDRSDEPGSLVRFAGRIDGRTVGTSVLYARHGVAGVYAVTTAGAYRQRGIGAALTLAALRAGYDRGLRIGTLQASADGERLYTRMGFETVAEYRLFAFA